MLPRPARTGTAVMAAVAIDPKMASRRDVFIIPSFMAIAIGNAMIVVGRP
jgi:hypothetical protein